MQEELKKLAADFWWTGDPWANNIWKELDPWLWEDLNHNPTAMLNEVSWENVSEEWKKKARSLLVRYKAFSAKPVEKDCPSITYFCMEFGLHESFPMYSGGLGILAGDHIRSAGDLKLDFTGLGLLYQHGYFAQLIHDGRQVAAHPNYLASPMPITPVLDKDGSRIVVDIPFRRGIMKAQAWKLQVGHAKLYLLDTQLPENTPEQQSLTKSLQKPPRVARPS